MKNLLLFSVFALLLGNAYAQLAPSEETLKALRKTNAYFMQKYEDPGKPIMIYKTWPSNIWTRAVYYEGLMALHGIDPQPAYYQYAVDWANAHEWNFRDGIETRNADNQCAGQTYLDLYEIDPQLNRLVNVQASLDLMMATDRVDDWDWIDAVQMAMPLFAQMGRIAADDRYFERMYEMYHHTKAVEGDHGMYNPEDALWWRDADYDPPYTEPNGEDCYWSRGNGWMVAALVRVLEDIPADEPHRAEYEADLKATLDALAKVQREDGFWNASLHDPDHYGGRETTGSALFIYGMAWAENTGLVPQGTYADEIELGWNALLTHAVLPTGFLGYVQSTGKEPSTGQPVTQRRTPDFEDYGLGCFLLGGVEVYKLSAAKEGNR
jgi:rhamnogalacturonyl hydrolase YesR